ncbi:cell surface protein precursor, GY family [bacterium endosymbiont of Mortierella elongata FMR23-6]|nr:cell surface protein precursor, GY family [bacterium endosymbiont of Mortierella elongata FMR23-6]
MATRVTTVASAATGAQESISTNETTVNNVATTAQESMATHVTTVASAATEAQESISTNETAVNNVATTAQENMATHVTTVASAATEAQESISTDATAVNNAATTAQENMATHLTTVASAALEAQEEIANEKADFMMVATTAKQNITANNDKFIAFEEKLDNFELRFNTIDATSGNHINPVLYDNHNRNTVTLGGVGSKTLVKLSNVAPGKISEDSTDAVNGAQLLEGINYSVQYTDQRFSEMGQGMNEIRQGMNEMGQNINDMRQSINNVANHAYSGVAAAMAMPNMGSVSPGRTMVSIGTASFKGHKATGVGVTYRSRGGQVVINAAASKAGSDAGMRVQVGYEF